MNPDEMLDDDALPEPVPSWKLPKPVDPEPVTVELWNPIKAFGQEVRFLTCAEKLDGFGLRKTRGLSNEDKALKIIEVLYRTPEGKALSFDNVCSLKTEDIQRLGEACGPFTGTGLIG